MSKEDKILNRQVLINLAYFSFMKRLNKKIAESGICSRRKADILIKSGRIKVNNKVISNLGYKVMENDVIYLDDKPLIKEEKVYYILNKPRNVISSCKDEKGRKTVLDIAYKLGVKERVFPVGRLDYNTAGLLILTNDGNFTQILTHPSYEIEKEYQLRVDGKIPSDVILKLNRDKMITFNNTIYNFKSIKKTGDKTFTGEQYQIVITEGKNHQVKNIFKALNKKVSSLTRIRIGSIKIESIGRGYLRRLKPFEIKSLLNKKGEK